MKLFQTLYNIQPVCVLRKKAVELDSDSVDLTLLEITAAELKACK